MIRARWIALATLAGVAASATGCGSSADQTAGPPASGGSGGDASADGPSDATTDGDSSLVLEASVGCSSNAQCDGGKCMPNGLCCASAALVCGDQCCGASQVCLFGACVSPGNDCVTPEDCPAKHYCEPALGETADAGPAADAGTAEAGANCTQEPPASGKCVPLPPVCEADGGPDGCFPPCEYHPPVGQLQATIKWQWGIDPAPTEYPNFADVWSTPTVARVFDANCDGRVDTADPPNVIFVSGNAKNTCCSCSTDAISTCRSGVLRMLDGANGREIWSLRKAQTSDDGFAGMSVAVGDMDGDKLLDIVAMTGGGYITVIGNDGTVKAVSDKVVDGYDNGSFGWGGGISVGDMDNDGWPEIAYGRTLFTYTSAGAVTRLWVGSGGAGNTINRALSHFVDLDGDGTLELLAGRTAYRKDGTTLWDNAAADGYTGIGDFDGNGDPEVVVVFNGTLRVLEGLDGATVLGPLTLPGTGNGGPPTVADFDGDGKPEIGVAQQNLYSMIKPDYANAALNVVWSQTNHDMSSSVTGSSVFDFEGDGKAEVIYNDECYLWVYDGEDGSVLYTDFTQSFTATEASIVADVDGDGHAEMLKISNGADPATWTCSHHDAPGKIVAPHTEAFPVWEPAPGGGDYRGITVLGDAANSWVGTRTLWNQHVYEVTNVCDPRDSACEPGSYYGQIPAKQKHNWEVPWLNNFRQNVQDKGVFDAPDVTVSLSVPCTNPLPFVVSVRNVGLSGLPAGVQAEVYKKATPDELLGTVTTTVPLLPGQTEVLPFSTSAATTSDTFFARILIDPSNVTFHECRDDNNESALVKPNCVQ